MMRRKVFSGSHRVGQQVQMGLGAQLNNTSQRCHQSNEAGGLSGLSGQGSSSSSTGSGGSAFGNLRSAIQKENEVNKPRDTKARPDHVPQSSAPRGFGGRSHADGMIDPNSAVGGGGNLEEDAAHNRVVAESVSVRDPLGGQYHRDYYRDPNTGFSPQYAPRNFGEGGHVEYHHPTDGKFSNLSDQARAATDHQLQKRQSKAAKQREFLRETATSRSQQGGNGAEDGLSLGITGRYENAGELEPRISLGQQQFDTTVQSAVSKIAVTPSVGGGNVVGGWHNLLEAKNAEREGFAPSSLGELNQADLEGALEEQHIIRERSQDDELMKKIHGTRSHEEFLERRSKFNLRHRGRSLNYDKHSAFWSGPASPLRPLPPITAPCNMSEAQKSLRQDSIDKNRALASRVLQRNSVSQHPKLGEDLAESIASAQDAGRSTDRRKEGKTFAQQMGIERTAAMVRDDGPDHRKISLGQNDLRLYDAARAFADDQRQGQGNGSTATRGGIGASVRTNEDVYARGNTQQGVDVFTRSSFDIKKRLDLQRKSLKDPSELNTIHYGSPVKQQIDQEVRLKQGSRGDRPLEFFQDEVKESALRLNQSYRDAEGFPLIKQSKLEFLEWELFARYRAHHLQRRQLALQHSLEPRKNETTSERDARRSKLDHLCETTLYNPSLAPALGVGDLDVGVGQLRHWFGAYMLPTPTIVAKVSDPTMTVSGLEMALRSDSETGMIDHSENLLSGRYLNRLFGSVDAFGNRMNRPQQATELLNRAPEPVLEHSQSSDVLRSFNSTEMDTYKNYQGKEIDRFSERWMKVHDRRRWHPTFKCYAELVAAPTTVATVTLRPLLSGIGGATAVAVDDGAPNLTVNYDIYREQIENSPNSVNVDGKTYSVIPDSRNDIFLCKVTLAKDGATVHMTLDQWDHLPLEVAMDPQSGLDPNFFVNNEQGTQGALDKKPYHYHRFNYIETQDAIWEERTYQGEEGWTSGHHADIHTGLVVKARAPMSALSSSTRGNSVVGDLEPAVVIAWEPNSSFNPAPYHVVLHFPNRTAKKNGSNNNNGRSGGDDAGSVMSVPLENILVWQCSWAGPGRTIPDLTVRPSQGMRRYLDIKNPSGKLPEPHFLDKHCPPKQNALQSVFNVQSLDKWEPAMDQPRTDNYRPLNLFHRKDLVSDHYIPQFTPWESIAIQEADSPMIKEDYLRSDYTGTSAIFATNRHWYHKPRPHAYVKNSPNEIKDLMEYVDTVTPWKKAQKIRSHHEIRRHAPMPVWNRHYTALHRNSTTMLPSQLLNLDKATGKIRSLKDSVESYRVSNVDPSWVSM